MRTDSLHRLLSSQLAVRLTDGALAMDLPRLDGVEPRTLDGQQAREDAHTPLAFDSSIVPPDPPPHSLAFVPTGVVPNQHPDALALPLKLLANPPQKLLRNGTDGTPLDETKKHLLVQTVTNTGIKDHPVAGQGLGIRVVFVLLLFYESKRFAQGPTVHVRLGKTTPPDFIEVADGPVFMMLGQANQTVSLFFLAHTAHRDW